MDENMTQGSFDELVNSIGAEGSAENTEQQQQEQNAAQEQAQEQPAVQKSEEQTQTHTKEEKEQYAWGKMNAENAALKDMLKKVADANGIKYTNNADLMQAMNDDAIAKMAEKQNVPVELLKKIESLEADAMAWREAQQRNSAARGFQTLKDTYGLDQSALESFAVELANAGLDPFKQNVDIVTQYKARHFDELVAAKVNAAVEAALKHDSTVSQFSSTPVTQQGVGDDGNSSQAITSVAQLDAMLAGLK